MIGVWIKLGQWASTRPDLFSPKITDSLSSLCRQVAPHSHSHTVSLLNQSFQRNEFHYKSGDGQIKDIFVDFPVEPVASGAVAQVYKAKLHSGEEVAVKVLHPGIAVTIARDLKILKAMASLMDKVPSWRFLNLPDVLTQFSAIMIGQVDLRTEVPDAVPLCRSV